MKGFTLLEVLIVVGILVSLSSMVIFSFFGQQQKAALGSEVENMTIRLRQAQSKAVSMEDDSKWGIHFENPAVGDDFYALFSGDAYITPIEKYFLPGGVRFDNPSTGNSFDVVFNKLKGNCTASSSVTVSLTANPSMAKIISVNSEGKISSQNQGVISICTVTFNKNGGDTEASPTTKTANCGSNVGTLPTAPTRVDYIFTGWNTAANGSGTVFTAVTNVIADITVYAQWEHGYSNP